MARSTREEKKTTEEQSVKKQIVWLLMQMGLVVNDMVNIKQQINILSEKTSCQHEAIARKNDACRTPPRQTNTGRAPRTRTPPAPPTPPTLPPRTQIPALPSLSPVSPLYSLELTELINILGPDFDIDLEIERNRYQKS